MIPIDFTYCSRDQIVTIYEPNCSGDFRLCSRGFKPSTNQLFHHFQMVYTIDVTKDCDLAQALSTYFHSMNSMISLWYNGYIVIYGNFSKYLPYLPYNLYPILGTAGPRVIVWPRHPASMRRFFFRPARENPLGFIAPEMGFSLWLWQTVRHGIDGPNRNRWFTELKKGGSFHGYVTNNQMVARNFTSKSCGGGPSAQRSKA